MLKLKWDISLDPDETDNIKSSSHPETPFEVKEAFSQKTKVTRLAYTEDSVTMEPLKVMLDFPPDSPEPSPCHCIHS